MRAITGAVLSSRPCLLAKAARILTRFVDSAASHLPSPNAATYLRTASDAADAHHLFRRDLRTYHHHGVSASASDRKTKKAMVAPALTPASASASERKIHKDRHSKESATHVKQEVEEIASPEKKRNKKKHPEEVKTDEKRTVVSAGDLASLAAEQGLASEKKRKKKRERGDDNDDDKEQVEHTRKKPRNRS
ncbi:hypothetical protein E2562_012639 [Oryza meyeriana var. granulata]|uniref:Uncharacterized protein n=1 Tax=Oryza meyeriana var. granulata TaxID=110450 RepID=A0A6G1CGP1_9ORYZ|nr:hypothetical protein E2562_012639 [Oryza meyeriana var. granulata]